MNTQHTPNNKEAGTVHEPDRYPCRTILSSPFLSRIVFTVLAAIAALSMAPTAAAQAELTGTGNPAVDIPAVQAAVSSGGDVFLKGVFSFTGGGSGSPLRVITISNSVRIAGVADAQGALPLIINGERPFFVSAPQASVSFENLGFQTPKTVGISITAVGNLRIAKCKFNGVVPGRIGTENVGITILSSGGPFGSFSIVDNEIDGQATTLNATNGIILSGTTSTVEILNNHVMNTSRHGIDLRNLVGDVHVQGNQIITGRLGIGGGVGQFVDAIRCVGPGKYLVEQNSFDMGFENGAVVRLGGTTEALLRENNISSSLPEDITPGPQNAAIQVEGTCNSNVILNNRVVGRARVAFSVIHSDFPLDKPAGTTGDPEDTSFIGNNHELCLTTVTGVEIGPTAMATLVIGGAGTVIDLGSGSILKGAYLTLSGTHYQSPVDVGQEVSNAELIWTQDSPSN